MTEDLIYKDILSKCSKKHGKLNALMQKQTSIGLPVPRYRSAEEHLIRAVIGQQISVRAANTIWQRALHVADGKKTDVLDILSPDFAEELRLCGVSHKKLNTIFGVRDFFKAHQLDNKVLTPMGHQDRTDLLTQIKGIGPWTCDMLSLFHFHEPDIWPITDGGIKRSLEMILNKDALSTGQLESFGETFKPYRSYLALYVWHFLDVEFLK